jgi:CRP/FNR family cyclic AMP-dependent transcriptional regulator
MRASTGSPKIKSNIKPKQNLALDVQVFLALAGVVRKVVEYRRSQKIYSQGDAAHSVMYLKKGGVKLSVVSAVGKVAVVAILGPGDFFGEGSMAGQRVRIGAATTIAPTTLLIFEKNEMIRLLHIDQALFDRFLSYMLSRKLRIEEDLVDQLFLSSEQRLARTLLRLAGCGKESRPERTLTHISQEVLSEMIGTTRPRVSFFMNKFRKLGFVRYNSRGLQVHGSLLRSVLREQ